MDVLLQAVIVFGAVMLGVRYKGIGLGIWGGAAVLGLLGDCGYIGGFDCVGGGQDVW